MAPPAHQLAGTLDNAGAIGVDVPCVACQYNLRGLTPEGTCPECGQAIAESLHAWQEAQHSGLNDPVFVRKLGRGMDIGLTAVVLALMGLLAFVIAIKCAWPRDVRMTLAWTMVILEAMACCLGGWGFWLFTAPSEVYPRLRRSIVRILLRWFTLVCLAQCALLILDLWDLPYWITHFTEMGIPLTAFCSLIFLKTYGVILANRLGNVTLGTFMGLSLAADLFLPLCAMLEEPIGGLPVGFAFVGLSVLVTFVLMSFLRRGIKKLARAEEAPQINWLY